MNGAPDTHDRGNDSHGSRPGAPGQALFPQYEIDCATEKSVMPRVVLHFCSKRCRQGDEIRVSTDKVSRVGSSANEAGENNRSVARMSSLLAGWPPGAAGGSRSTACAVWHRGAKTAAPAMTSGEAPLTVANSVKSMSRPVAAARQPGCFDAEARPRPSRGKTAARSGRPRARAPREIHLEVLAKLGDRRAFEAFDFQVGGPRLAAP